MATSTDLRAAIEEVQGQLPADQIGEGDLLDYESDFATRLERRVGALPWWVISAVVHSVLFLLCTLIGVAMPPPSLDEVTITSDMAKKEEPKFDQKKKRDIFKNPQEVEAETQVENPVVVHEQTEVSDAFETDNDMDSQTARGHEDAISDIPLGGTGVTGSMGVGGGGMAGCFGYRGGGGRKKAVARFGGSKATESAVEAALRWLARHQNADGSWNRGADGAKQRPCVGLTGISVLAFLGAGYTHKNGKFKDNVNRALKFIVKRQQKNGAIGGHGHLGYFHGIAGLALVEAYGMSKDPGLKESAQKAVDYTKFHQDPYKGWRYKAKEAGDVSVSGWFVMQLKSAKVAGLRVDGSCFQGAMNFIDKCTNKTSGAVGYRAAPKSNWMPRNKPGMIHRRKAIGVVSRLFMGAQRDDPILLKSGKYCADAPPLWSSPDFYYWYYGTLAMFQMGGDQWKSWNKGLKSALVPHQRQGGPMDGSARDVDGSWDYAQDPYGGKISWSRCGRVYTTALGALCLEVYYRYLPMYAK